jgi:hypothetical protein
MRKALIFVFALALSHTVAFATAQAPDVLLYDNKVYDLYANPLETFYKDEASRPRFQVQPGTISSGNWRGYVAIWEIEGDTLFLKGIDSWVCDPTSSDESCRKADLKELFGQQFRAGKVEATWFSGELRIPDGKMLQYVHMGYGTIYERDIILTLQSGKVTKRNVIDNTKRKIPSSLELQRRELEKLKDSPAGNRKTTP